MSEPRPATLTFLSWLRQGIATATRSPLAEPTASRAKAAITIRLKEGLEATANLALFGPGDVTGLDPRVVIRTWPQAGAHDVPPNYFPLLELDQPDLPWRYTPAAPDDQDRLLPWLCLIVLAESEFTPRPPSASDRLPAIKVDPQAPLPDLKQAWAWAHIQVSGEAPVDGPACARLLTSHPERLLARLLCPRRLIPATAYAAFLVPVFERGRLAGLGEEPKDTAASQLAWDVAQRGGGALSLPVYYEWRFATGAAGDFEYLVTRLQPRTLPASVGTRPLDVSQPGAGLPPASRQAMGLEAALRSPAASSTLWPEGGERAAFVQALQERVNQPDESLQAENSDPKLAPPLYGRWHAACRRLKPNDQPTWFHHLNADPRPRVAAGVGTEVVRRQQQQLMASAWRQAEGIEAINAELRLAQAAREAAMHVYERDLAHGDIDTVLQVTAPLHTRAAHGTVAQELADSPIVDGVFEPQFRRLARRFGPIGRRQGRDCQPEPGNLLDRMNQGDLAAAPPPPEADKMVMVTLDRSCPGQTPASLLADLGNDQIAARQVLTILGKRETVLPRQPADLEAILRRLLEELDPRQAISATYRHRLHFKAGTRWQPEDPLETILVAPEFPQPMYEPLAALSQDWLLPGLDRVPANTIALAVSNQAFIEAYMVGLNHEMARELLWNEYPTDQRGSYFRQFWDPRGYIAPEDNPIDPESLKDIQPIHRWSKTATLGENRPEPAAGAPLVLLLRGDLLARYPNTTVYAVQAKAGPPGQEPELGTQERHPLFSGQLAPDVSFFGFELTVDQACGVAGEPGWFIALQEQPSEPCFGLDAADGPQPQPVAHWEQLSWGHLAQDANQWQRLAYIDLNAALPKVSVAGSQVAWYASQGSCAAHLAYITLQKPVRVAIYAADMLPSKEEQA